MSPSNNCWKNFCATGFVDPYVRLDFAVLSKSVRTRLTEANSGSAGSFVGAIGQCAALCRQLVHDH